MRASAVGFRSFVPTALLVSLLAAWPGTAVAAGDWAWPVDGEVLTDYRNGADPYASGQHRGVDIAAPVGEPVRAATAGFVTFAGTVGSSGLVVSVRTADGRFDTSYLHMGSTEVATGDRIEPGEELGTVGVTGTRSATDPHVHFGVRDAGERHAYRDPLLFLAPPGSPAPEPPPPGPALAPVRLAPRPVLPPVPVLAPAPGPAPAPRDLPRPVPAPRPALVPQGAPRPAPRVHPGRRPVPGGAPRRAPRPGASPTRQPAPSPSPAPHRTPQPEPAGKPIPDPGRGPVGAPRPDHAPASVGEHPGAGLAVDAGPAGGIDPGWVLACIGLALAAALAGGPARRRLAARGQGSVSRTAGGSGYARRPRAATGR